MSAGTRELTRELKQSNGSEQTSSYDMTNDLRAFGLDNVIALGSITLNAEVPQKIGN